VWLRYTIHKRVNEEPAASLWLTVFDAGATQPSAIKRTYTSAELSFPRDGYIRIHQSNLQPGRAEGNIARDAAGLPTVGASWALEFDDGAPAFHHLPYGWLYRAPLPRTKPLSPYPRTSMSGTVSIGDRRLLLDGWPATIGHNWGTEHAERWIWIEAADLDGGTSYFDLVAGRLLVGSRTTPWIANGVAAIGGERFRLGGLTGIRKTVIKETPTGCEFSIAGRGARITGRVQASAKDIVGWRYADPLGGEHDTLNCSIANLDITVHARDAVTHLAARGSAAYELGVRERDHGIAIQPYADGEPPA
jgi:hypothetical protein